MQTHALKLPTKCFLLLVKLLGTHCAVPRNIILCFGCSCKGQGVLKLPLCSEILTFAMLHVTFEGETFEGLFESSTFVYALIVLYNTCTVLIDWLNFINF